ncbi:ribosomal l33 domain-containing protein [Rhizoctonia solani AG-1 IA]|uniref:Large ribosomal subunit protein bL33m n=1 Tax=Thanatephorus cucumeris (strain AG1-IA) TaxID=983506 RepID=L8WV55_THACA|nr:ribosomal l33 domain-containing protein [Rhizoctonia solani AG-1 IA]
MAAKSKAKTILVKLVSTAQTGYFYTTTRPRLGEKLVRMKYDPKGESWTAFRPQDWPWAAHWDRGLRAPMLFGVSFSTAYARVHTLRYIRPEHPWKASRTRISDKILFHFHGCTESVTIKHASPHKHCLASAFESNEAEIAAWLEPAPEQSEIYGEPEPSPHVKLWCRGCHGGTSSLATAVHWAHFLPSTSRHSLPGRRLGLDSGQGSSSKWHGTDVALVIRPRASIPARACDNDVHNIVGLDLSGVINFPRTPKRIPAVVAVSVARATTMQLSGTAHGGLSTVDILTLGHRARIHIPSWCCQ